jgi:hypothetical protein
MSKRGSPTQQWSDILIFIAMFHGQNMFLDHGKMPWFPWVFNERNMMMHQWNCLLPCCVAKMLRNLCISPIHPSEGQKPEIYFLLCPTNLRWIYCLTWHHFPILSAYKDLFLVHGQNGAHVSFHAFGTPRPAQQDMARSNWWHPPGRQVVPRLNSNDVPKGSQKGHLDGDTMTETFIDSRNLQGSNQVKSSDSACPFVIVPYVPDKRNFNHQRPQCVSQLTPVKRKENECFAKSMSKNTLW